MKRVISIVMLLVMTLSLITIVHADPAVSGEPNETGEVIELREKNSQTYRLDDGSYECVVYAEDKYFEDENGELIEIDNSVVPQKQVCGGREYAYTNRANSTHIAFAENEPAVLVSSKAHSLAFGLQTQGAAGISVGGLKSIEAIAGYPLSGDNMFAYTGVLQSTDFVYEVRSGAVKEYIVLYDSSAPTEFTFTYDSEGYTAAYTELGTIGFYDGEGELCFELSNLFAVDSAEAYTEELAYTIGETSNGKTEITVSLSEEYAHDPERVYPVLIDPSETVTGEYSTQDSYVSSKYPTTNYYMNTYLRMGYDSNYYVRRSFIRFNLSATVPSNFITSACLRIRRNSNGYNPSIKAYRVTGSWTSSTINWNNKPSTTILYASDTATLDTNNWFLLDVSKIVKRWYTGEYQNYGFMLRDATESGTGYWSTFYSSDAASPNKPELVIRYITYYGSRPYQQVNSGSVNCMGYALEYDLYIDNTELGLTESSLYSKNLADIHDTIRNAAETWMNNHLYDPNNPSTKYWQSIDRFDDDIQNGWFRVALRVGFKDKNYNGVLDSGEPCDYHWWYQTNNNSGQWAEKMASNPSNAIANSSFMDPATLPWSWGGYDYFYTSEPSYYKIKDVRNYGW